MTEELQQRTAALLDYLEVAIRSTTDFATEQTPDVIHQLLVWNFITSLILFSVSFVSLIAIVVVTYKIAKCVIPEKQHEVYVKHMKELLEEEEIEGLFIVSCVVFSFAVCTLVLNMDWLQIWIAPKLYLLEYASSLLK